MKPTSDEFRGKLSSAGAALMDITIKRYRQAQLLGIKVELESWLRPDVKSPKLLDGNTPHFRQGF
jgi:hypothetical protein